MTFLTSTREPSNILFSSYPQHHRHRNVEGIADKEEMRGKLEDTKSICTLIEMNEFI